MIELKKTVIENAQIIYKHFAGGMSGKPSFCIALDEKLAEEFREGGWPVKTYAKAPDESGHVSEPTQFLEVKLYFKGEGEDTTPIVVSKDSGTGKKKRYNANTIHRLDELRITNASAEIRPWYCDTKQYQGWCIALNRLYVEFASSGFDSLFDMDEGDDWATDDVDTL